MATKAGFSVVSVTSVLKHEFERELCYGCLKDKYTCSDIGWRALMLDVVKRITSLVMGTGNHRNQHSKWIFGRHGRIDSNSTSFGFPRKQEKAK